MLPSITPFNTPPYAAEEVPPSPSPPAIGKQLGANFDQTNSNKLLLPPTAPHPLSCSHQSSFTLKKKKNPNVRKTITFNSTLTTPLLITE